MICSVTERWGSGRPHQHPSSAKAVVARMDVPLIIDLRQLRRDALSGRVSVEQLLDIIERQRHAV